jgi:hypothetical protein
MFCSNCGKPASGNFCAYCGHKLNLPVDDEILTVLPADWSHEVRYDILTKIPEVRERLGRAAAAVRKSLTGEDYAKIFDKVFSPGVPLSKVIEIAQPLYASWGIQTGKTRSGFIPTPTGKVIVDVLCTLARTNRTLKNVRQATDGCVLEASLPSDLMSLEGEIVLSIRRETEGTHIDAATKIPGQLYDWGKSNRCLHKLFDDLGAVA